VSGMRGVEPVAVLLERGPRRLQRLRRPTQVARDERDLGLGHRAARPGQRLPRTEGPGGAAHERARPDEIAELRHRDATEGESGRVVAQGDPLQGAQGIPRRQRTAGGRDQRVHRNPVTLVTPIGRYRALDLSHEGRRARVGDGEGSAMTTHKTGTRQEWLAARLELLQAEKELVHRSDELARRRQELPWVRIDRDYRFETDE